MNWLKENVSKKLTVTLIVIGLCALWMFGGDNVQRQMKDAPEQLKGFLGWLSAIVPMVMAIVAGTYNIGQGNADSAKETAKGQVEATRLAIKTKD